MTIEDKIDEILRNHESWKKAHRRGDRKRVQVLRDRFEELAGELMESADGRAAMEELLQNPSSRLRYAISTAVIEWAPEKAIPVLARLLYEPLDENMEPWEEVSVRIHARMPLAYHFGYHPADWTELPERLAEHGIDLPDETVRRLHWKRDRLGWPTINARFLLPLWEKVDGAVP